ncbi:hypothetical protein EU508_17790 [Pseudoalteromonas fuliginea]|uniref:Type I restriction modification DNA specificity domain-containing protein n=1 Tax=Pseudoalteromonas fuliginea TaxID=1872678 RepID=A0AB73BDA5_9GAMM|nr:restriction endonuclease subunit S [Pseudoalteromonas fuliginea]KAA1157571.1 hypothetical protein EU508_17790 [Pseudoalteromonas fuliginea]
MGSNWQSISLENFAQHQKGFAFKSKDYIEKGVAVVRVSNLNTNSIDISDLKYISEEVASNKSNFKLAHNDVIIATVGSWPNNPASVVGKVIKVPRNCDNFLLNQNAVRFRVKSEDPHDQLFLYYLLKSKTFSDYIISTAQGSANQASITLKDIYAFEFECPSASVRKEIANILSAIDDKSSLNNQTNQTLERMAQAWFKSWFVDFDPVFDNLLASVDFKLENLETSLPDELKQKAQRRLAALNSLENATECKASLIALAHELQAQTQAAVQVSEKTAETPVKPNFSANPKILAQHASTHALFPNEFEHSEQLGWIPKGWSVDNLSIIAKFTSERVHGDDLTFDNYISTDNMRANRGGITKASKIPAVKTTPGFHPGHILISNIRPYFKKIWLATSSGGRSNDVLGFEALEPKNTGYLFNLLFQDVFFDYMMATSKGSKMPRGDKKAIMDWMVVMPPDHIQENYSMLVKEFHKAILLRNKEIDTLTELRNVLLPKLISGELRIPDVATDDETVD